MVFEGHELRQGVHAQGADRGRRERGFLRQQAGRFQVQGIRRNLQFRHPRRNRHHLHQGASRVRSTSTIACRWKKKPATTTPASAWRSISSAPPPRSVRPTQFSRTPRSTKWCRPRLAFPSELAGGTSDRQGRHEQCIRLDVEDFKDPGKLDIGSCSGSRLWGSTIPSIQLRRFKPVAELVFRASASLRKLMLTINISKLGEANEQGSI